MKATPIPGNQSKTGTSINQNKVKQGNKWK